MSTKRHHPLGRTTTGDLLVEWSFEYEVNPGGRRVQRLDKMDLEHLGGRDQIKIWGHSVRAYIGEKTDIVCVDMELPQQVDRIILFKFGQADPVCYAEYIEDLVVYPGNCLQKNPFTHQEQCRRLKKSTASKRLRRQRKGLV